MKHATPVWDVVPLVPLSARSRQVFAYAAPSHLGALEPGTLVRIPFGRRTAQGIVRGRRARPPQSLKAITRVLSPIPLFAPAELAALERLAACSLEPFASMVASATRVREPLRGGNRAGALVFSRKRGSAGGPALLDRSRGRVSRGRHAVTVRWGPVADALPSSADGQTLLLVPELSIVPRILDELAGRGLPAARFAQGLRVRERRTTIERLARGEPLVVVATHAGVFLPFPALSRITVVEAALASHRQWDLHPRYDARVAALLLAQERRVPLTLQSSLPSLDLAVLDGGNNPSSLLPAPYSLLPRKPSDPLLSPPVLSAIRETLRSKGSVFLFHDIVGEERAFACDTCGALLRCEACGGLLERSGSRLRCRVCGTDGGPVPHFCPRCKSPHIAARRIGTARLEWELTHALPSDIRVMRADRETLPRRSDGRSPVLGSPGAPTRISDSRGWEAPAPSVLLGSERALAACSGATVDRVIVLDADRILEEPSYDAAERWLAVLGRLAALQRPGGSPPLLQTTHGSLAVVRALAGETFAVWLDRELSDRETLGYPPFAAVLSLCRSFPVLARASAAARLLAAVLARQISPERVGVRVAGSAPRVRAEVLLRGPLPELQRVLPSLPSGWAVDPHIPLSHLLQSS